MNHEFSRGHDGSLRWTRRELTQSALALGAGLLFTRHGRAATGKGTAVLGIDAEPPTLNLGTTTDFPAGDVSAKILEGLVWLDPQYNPKPSLATAWTVSPDGLSYRFLLHDVQRQLAVVLED